MDDDMVVRMSRIPSENCEMINRPVLGTLEDKL